MTLQDLLEAVRGARGQRDQARYLTVVNALVGYVNAVEPVDMPAADEGLLNQIIAECFTWEASWGLYLGDVLWRAGRQQASDFTNQWNLATFAGFSGRHSMIDNGSHLALARDVKTRCRGPVPFILLGNVLRAMHDYAGAENAYLEGIHGFPDYPFLKFRLAALYLATQRIEQGKALLRPLRFAYPQAREMMFLADLAPPPVILDNLVSEVSAQGKAMVCMVAADPVYMERYAVPLLRSMPEAARARLHFHFHIVCDSAEDEQRERYAELASLCPGARFTVRKTPLAALAPERRKALLASERFFMLPELLRKYATPMLVLDIDLECLRDPFELLAATGPNDIGYANFAETTESWERYAAGALVVRPSEAAAQLFRRLGEFVLGVLNSHPQPWFVDQIALFRLFEEEGTPAKARWLPGVFCDSRQAPGKAYFRVLHAGWT